MTAQELKQLYPLLGVTVERDAKERMGKYSTNAEVLNVIAHNAAFEACYHVNKYLSKKKKMIPKITGMVDKILESSSYEEAQSILNDFIKRLEVA